MYEVPSLNRTVSAQAGHIRTYCAHRAESTGPGRVAAFVDDEDVIVVDFPAGAAARDLWSRSSDDGQLCIRAEAGRGEHEESGEDFASGEHGEC